MRGPGGGGDTAVCASPLSCPAFAAATAPPVPCPDAATRRAKGQVVPHDCVRRQGEDTKGA